MNFHQPVLLDETLQILKVAPNKTYLDATLGNGGHSLEILKKGAVVYGLDQDPGNLEIATRRIQEAGYSKNFHPIHGNFSQLKKILKKHKITTLNGILFDLGLSKNQQISQDRGFSFNDSSSLDMRLDPTIQTETAENIINTADFDTLYQIFTKLAQEKYSKPIILRIIRQRQQKPIQTAKRLADIIRNYYQTNSIPTKIDPSTKVFMALRIYINQEFENLRSALKQTLEILPSNAIVAVISFHSGEDRIVKQFIRQNSPLIQNLTPKAILPKQSEININPLSRSAVLRSFKII
jgi:16S rRNA (cytosine1402-N4)-methyltransferase